VKNGVPSFADISEAAGLQPFEMKSPHVEIHDFDNGDWPDVCEESIHLSFRVAAQYLEGYRLIRLTAKQFRLRRHANTSAAWDCRGSKNSEA